MKQSGQKQQFFCERDDVGFCHSQRLIAASTVGIVVVFFFFLTRGRILSTDHFARSVCNEVLAMDAARDDGRPEAGTQHPHAGSPFLRVLVVTAQSEDS